MKILFVNLLFATLNRSYMFINVDVFESYPQSCFGLVTYFDFKVIVTFVIQQIAGNCLHNEDRKKYVISW